MAKPERKTVQLDAETHQALVAYSQLTNIPIGRVISRAVRDWMKTVGQVHIEVMAGQAGSTALAQTADVDLAGIAPGSNQQAAH